MVDEKIEMQVDTDAVSQTAVQVNYCNTVIDSHFEDFEKKIRILNNSWEGKAAQNTMKAFDDLKKKWSENRKERVDDMIEYLSEIVGSGFELTENENKTLSEQFK